MDTKIDTFCQIDIRDLAILGVEKVDSKNFLNKNAGFFFSFFLNLLSYQGERF